MSRLALGPVLLVVASPASAGPTHHWTHHIAEASARFGVPEAWIRRVMRAESGGRTSWRGRPIRSQAGAIGLMQLMPGTWRAMRRRHGLGWNPDDPRDNILAGTAYLRAMHDRFGYPGLFAAYNAGPARYADHLAHGTRLPAETTEYIAKVAGGSGRFAPVAASMHVAHGRESSLIVLRSRERTARAGNSGASAALARQSVFFELRTATKRWPE